VRPARPTVGVRWLRVRSSAAPPPAARLGLRALQPTLGERAVDVDNLSVQVDVAPFEREPFGRTKSGGSRDNNHRPLAPRGCAATASSSAHDSNGRCSLRRGDGLSGPSFAGLRSIIPQTAATRLVQARRPQSRRFGGTSLFPAIVSTPRVLMRVAVLGIGPRTQNRHVRNDTRDV
jgi:hypothetical protein